MTDTPCRCGRIRTFAAVAIALVLASLLAVGCVLTMPEAFLKQRQLENGAVPPLKGEWQDEEGAILTVSPVRRTTNTFTAVSGGKDGALEVILERLDPNRFIMQVTPKDGRGVFLTIAEVTENRVVVYTYPDSLDAIRKAADENGVTVTDNGLIVKYVSARGIIAFFRVLADMPDHKDFVFTRR
jgi:hypothetical protein